MKYKKLTKNQIIISIDRLTRFKSPVEKYVRVFNDIIISNLIEPKYKKSELEQLPFETLRDYAVEIFNSSLEELSADYSINNYLKEYESRIFNINNEAKVLLDNNLDYMSALEYLEEPESLNLKWLLCLKDNMKNVEDMRFMHSLQYPLRGVVIVEGITEEILLPTFAEVLGFDFLKTGIKVLPAGGKNQVVKLYYKMSEQLKLPIFVLLDKDAEENAELINQKLRPQDSVYIINSGEFEDTLPKNLILKTLNKDMKNFATINQDELLSYSSMVEALGEIFKEKGLHEFKKADFATQVKSNISKDVDASDEIREIISKIKKLLV